MHSHPSANTRPSAEDKRFTAILFETLSSMGIALLDNIIVSQKGFYSFYADGEITKLHGRSIV